MSTATTDHHQPAQLMQWPRGRSRLQIKSTAGELARNANFSSAEAVLIVEAHDGGRGVSLLSLSRIWNTGKTTIRSVVNGETYTEATREARKAIAPLAPAPPALLCPYCNQPAYSGRDKRNNPPVVGRCGRPGCRRPFRLVDGVYVKAGKR